MLTDNGVCGQSFLVGDSPLKEHDLYMSSTLGCCTPCNTTTTVNVPGSEGSAGTDGVDGINAFTHTSTDFDIPAIGGTVTVDVESSAWMVIGQCLIIGVGADGVGSGPAHFNVTAIPSTLTVTLEFLGATGDLEPGDTITAGSTVSPSAVATPAY